MRVTSSISSKKMSGACDPRGPHGPTSYECYSQLTADEAKDLLKDTCQNHPDCAYKNLTGCEMNCPAMDCCTTSPSSQRCDESQMDTEALTILDKLCGLVDDYAGLYTGLKCDSNFQSFYADRQGGQQTWRGIEKQAGAASRGITCAVKPGTPNKCVFNRNVSTPTGDIVYTSLNANRDGICQLAKNSESECIKLGNTLGMETKSGFTPFCRMVEGECKGSEDDLMSNIMLCKKPVINCAKVPAGTYCLLPTSRTPDVTSKVVGRCDSNSLCQPFDG